MNRIGGEIEHRRRRRGRGALPARCQRRPPPQRDQAGGLGPLRRDHQLPGQRRRAADQDGAGRQARRGRPVARPQGGRGGRPRAPLHPRRAADFAAAAPRHLFHRGSGAAHLRPEERQSAGADLGEAGGRGGRGHGGGGRGQGARRRGADQRPRRRHRRFAAYLDQTCRHPLGTRPGRNPAGAGDERPARPHPRAGRWQAADRPRRGDRALCWAPRNSASPPRRWSPWAAS